MLAALAISVAASAELRIPSQFSDGMVLQQKSEAAIWGWANKGSQVSVSFNGKTFKGKADSDGRWTVKVSTPEASYKAYQLKITGDGKTVTFNDVLVGEVWIASGQSNMEMPMRGFFNCPVEGSAAEYARRPNRDGIRMYTALTNQSYEPLDEIASDRYIGWRGADPDNIKEMSATAYYFARQVNETLDIPVGIVALPYGGARVESWLPEATVRAYGTEDLSHATIDAMSHYVRPFLMYNAMQKPLQGYTAKGFIWYQGCSNVGHHEEFVDRMSEMVRQWREDWGDTNNDMPFYMVEIAPYRYKPYTVESNAALLRQAQHDAAKAIPNCGCIVTNDLVSAYEQDNIHPCKKKEVGERLAYLALNRNYGCSGIACDSPEAIELIRIDGSSSEIGVKFTNCPNGMDRWMEIQGLEVCGSEQVWVPVKYAYYEWAGYLRIRVDGVFDPSQVRYGWGDFNPGNLHNAEGLPVTPFWLKLED